MSSICLIDIKVENTRLLLLSLKPTANISHKDTLNVLDTTLYTLYVK